MKFAFLIFTIFSDFSRLNGDFPLTNHGFSRAQLRPFFNTFSRVLCFFELFELVRTGPNLATSGVENHPQLYEMSVNLVNLVQTPVKLIRSVWQREKPLQLLEFRQRHTTSKVSEI